MAIPEDPIRQLNATVRASNMELLRARARANERTFLPSFRILREEAEREPYARKRSASPTGWLAAAIEFTPRGWKADGKEPKPKRTEFHDTYGAVDDRLGQAQGLVGESTAARECWPHRDSLCGFLLGVPNPCRAPERRGREPDILTLPLQDQRAREAFGRGLHFYIPLAEPIENMELWFALASAPDGTISTSETLSWALHGTGRRRRAMQGPRPKKRLKTGSGVPYCGLKLKVPGGRRIRTLSQKQTPSAGVKTRPAPSSAALSLQVPEIWANFYKLPVPEHVKVRIAERPPDAPSARIGVLADAQLVCSN